MKSITYYLDNPQTRTLAGRYGVRFQKMTPETKLHLINLVTSASLRNLSPKEAERTKDIPFESPWAQQQYELALNIIRAMPTDEKTIASFVEAIAQSIN